MPVATAGLTCNRLSLLEALTAVSSVVPSRSPKPILHSVLLHATPDGTTLAATDLEVGCRHRVLGVQCDNPSRLVLPPARLKSILQTADDEVVYLATDEDKLTIRGQRFCFTLSLEDPDLFPAVPEFTAAAFVTVAPADLRKLIRRTIYATDPESVRYALGGCLIEHDGDLLTMVGTDGRRLSRQVVPCGVEGDAAIEGQPVIPAKGLKLIDRLLDDTDVPVELAADRTRVLVRTEQAVVYSRLVEGRYPNYRQVFPSESTSAVTVDAGALLDGMTSAAIMTSEESRGVDLFFEGDTLRLVSQAADVGSGVTSLSIVTLAGDPVTLTLDPRYLMDSLKPLSRDAVVRLQLLNEKSPLVLKVDDGGDVVVMPLTRER